MTVRPEQVAILRDRKVVEPCLEPPIQSQSPYFMDNNNPQKRITKGLMIQSCIYYNVKVVKIY